MPFQKWLKRLFKFVTLQDTFMELNNSSVKSSFDMAIHYLTDPTSQKQNTLLVYSNDRERFELAKKTATVRAAWMFHYMCGMTEMITRSSLMDGFEEGARLLAPNHPL